MAGLLGLDDELAGAADGTAAGAVLGRDMLVPEGNPEVLEFVDLPVPGPRGKGSAASDVCHDKGDKGTDPYTVGGGNLEILKFCITPVKSGVFGRVEIREYRCRNRSRGVAEDVQGRLVDLGLGVLVEVEVDRLGAATNVDPAVCGRRLLLEIFGGHGDSRSSFFAILLAIGMGALIPDPTCADDFLGGPYV